MNDSQQTTIGIVAALSLEISPLMDLCEQGRTQHANGLTFWEYFLGDLRLVIVVAGTGMKQARQATQALLDGCAASWVISTGFSGALKEGMRIGDIVVGTGIVHASGTPKLKIDVNMFAAERLHVAPVCTADGIVHRVDDKKAIGEQTGTVAVDMESLAVAQVCQERHVPCMVVRVISDDLSADLPPEVLTILGPKGTVRAGALIGSIWKRPSSVKDLWAMREKASHAAERLAHFLKSLLDQLAPGD